MTVRNIIQAPDERLLRKSEPVAVGGTVLGTLIGDLMETRSRYKAFGLSAPQIGVHFRVVAVDPRGFHGFRVLINPEIIELSGPVFTAVEGCMSIDWGRRTFMVKRHTQARIRFLDVHAQERTATTAGFATRLICHEVDHLDGKLIGADDAAGRG